MMTNVFLAAMVAASICVTVAVQVTLRRKLRRMLNALFGATANAEPTLSKRIAMLDPRLPCGRVSGFRLEVLLHVDFRPFGPVCVQLAQRMRDLRQKQILGWLPLLVLPVVIKVILAFTR